jgi:hypothetical protein
MTPGASGNWAKMAELPTTNSVSAVTSAAARMMCSRAARFIAHSLQNPATPGFGQHSGEWVIAPHLRRPRSRENRHDPIKRPGERSLPFADQAGMTMRPHALQVRLGFAEDAVGVSLQPSCDLAAIFIDDAL